MNSSSQLKIFVVDDEIFYLNILKQHICNLGYEDVTTFESGTECLDRLSEKPDVIFLDYNMDILSGYDILKKIKRFDPNIYVVMISGQEEIKPVIDTLKHGAFDYIKKGDVEEEKIKIVLESVLEVKDLLERSKPNLLKKLFEFL
jgi:polysaccharide export outer membrane protein